MWQCFLKIIRSETIDAFIKFYVGALHLFSFLTIELLPCCSTQVADQLRYPTKQQHSIFKDSSQKTKQMGTNKLIM